MAAAAGTSGRRQQCWHRKRRWWWGLAAAATLLLVVVALATTATAAADHDLLPTESDALAAGLGYLPSTDPSGMILLPRPLGALPPQHQLGESGLAVLASASAASGAPSSSSAIAAEEERAEAAELLEEEDKEAATTTTTTTTKGPWAMAVVVGKRAAAALLPPRGSAQAPQAARPPPLLVPEDEEEEKTEEDETSSDSSDSSPSARRDAFALAVQRDLQAALDDARRAYPDGDFPAPVAAAAAARVLAARTPAELRSRSAALTEAKRKLLDYNGFASPCGPSCAPGACLPAVNPYTYAQTGSPGYLPGPFSGTGGHSYLKHYNGNGVIGLYSCRRCVNDCYEQKPYPNTNVQMCVCKPGCGIVRGAYVPICDRGSQGDWVKDEQVRIRNGEAGVYRGAILDTPIPLVGKASEGIVITPADRAALQAMKQQQGVQPEPPKGRGGGGRGDDNASGKTTSKTGGRNLLYIFSKQQFAAAAGCNYVRQNYCRRCPINYYQQVGNLTSAVCSPCPFDRPTTAGMTGSPTCFVACNPAQAEDDPARPIYAYTREDCVATSPTDDDPNINANILNYKYPELFPPFSDSGSGSAAALRAEGGGGGEGEGAKMAWDPFSYDGPPMPLRVPRSRWIVEKKKVEEEGDGEEGRGEGGDGSGLRLRGGPGGEGEEEEEEATGRSSSSSSSSRGMRSARRAAAGRRRRRRGWMDRDEEEQRRDADPQADADADAEADDEAT